MEVANHRDRLTLANVTDCVNVSVGGVYAIEIYVSRRQRRMYGLNIVCCIIVLRIELPVFQNIGAGRENDNRARGYVDKILRPRFWPLFVRYYSHVFQEDNAFSYTDNLH